MQRREFITLFGGAAVAWPLSVRAQQAERVRRIGVLLPLSEDDPEGEPRLAAFRQRLQQLGWTEGRNVRIETRWGGGIWLRHRRLLTLHTRCVPRCGIKIKLTGRRPH